MGLGIQIIEPPANFRTIFVKNCPESGETTVFSSLSTVLQFHSHATKSAHSQSMSVLQDDLSDAECHCFSSNPWRRMAQLPPRISMGLQNVRAWTPFQPDDNVHRRVCAFGTGIRPEKSFRWPHQGQDRENRRRIDAFSLDSAKETTSLSIKFSHMYIYRRRKTRWI